jgi:hypothetical protein
MLPPQTATPETSQRNATNISARQDISPILCNPKVHRRVHNRQPLIRPLNQTYPFHTFPPFSVRPILTLLYHIRLRLPSGLFLSVFNTKPLRALTFSSMRATYTAQPNSHLN